jgi:hypothetical protein
MITVKPGPTVLTVCGLEAAPIVATFRFEEVQVQEFVMFARVESEYVPVAVKDAEVPCCTDGVGDETEIDRSDGAVVVGV